MIRSIVFVCVLAMALSLPCLAKQTGSGQVQTIHAATPRPTARPTPKPALPAPGKPHYTTDPQACTKNGGSGDACAQLKRGKLISLYWPWSCTGANCAVGGYHVWRAGRPAKIIDATPARIVIASVPQVGTCYYVTAYAAPNHTIAESKPSRHVCFHATYKTITIKADRSRGYTREYWVLYSDNNPQVQTYPARGGSDLNVGGTFVEGVGQSQANTFQRAAYQFSLSSIGGNSIFGASFEYTKSKYDSRGSCAELHRAPNGWQTASWIASNNAPLPGKKFTLSGSTMSWPIDKLILTWNRSTPLPLFLEEVYGVGPAEFIKSGVMPYSFSCQSVIVDPRIVVKVGITV